MNTAPLYCLAGVVAMCTAGRGLADGISNDDLQAYLGTLQVEARLDTDLTGDGTRDVVYVASSANQRVVGILTGSEAGSRLGNRVVAEGVLDGLPRETVSVTFKHGVLGLHALAGDDSLTEATYRYRYDKQARRVRLISVEAEHYSVGLEHDATRVSWDLLTGRHVVEVGKVVTLDTGDRAYVYDSARRTSCPSPPVYMEDTPDLDAMLAAGTRPEAKVLTDR